MCFLSYSAAQNAHKEMVELLKKSGGVNRKVRATFLDLHHSLSVLLSFFRMCASLFLLRVRISLSFTCVLLSFFCVCASLFRLCVCFLSCGRAGFESSPQD